MILKTKSSRIPLLFASLLLLVVLVLSINKEKIKEESYSILDIAMAQDLGVSGLSEIYGVSSFGELSKEGHGILLGLIKYFPERVLARLPVMLKAKLTGFPDRPPIDRIDIDIKFTEFKKVLADRDRGIRDGVLIDPQEVRGKIRFHNRQMKAEIRLKGDLFEHWRSRTSMSLRVTLKGDDTILGFTQFSLHKPAGRQFPYDHIFQDFVREAGVLSARHNFIHVFVNGQDWGLMDIEEHMTKALLEKQAAKESIIVKFGDEQSWHYNAVTNDPYKSYRLSDKKIFISLFQEKKYLNEPLHRQHFSYISDKITKGQENDILDTDSFSRASIAALIWNDYHTLSTSNTRFYFNPYILKLEPVTTDQAPFVKIDNSVNKIPGFFESPSTWLFREVLSSEEGKKRFSYNLSVVLAAAEKIPEIAAFYESFFPNDIPRDFSILKSNMEAIKLHSNFIPSYELEKEIGATQEIFPTAIQASNLPVHIRVLHYDDGRLLLINLLNAPVNIESITYKGDAIKFDDKVVPPYSLNNGLLTIKTDKAGIQDESFKVTTSILGYKRETANGPTLVTNLVNPFYRSEAFPDYITKKDKGFRIAAGTHIVTKPLVINGNLTLDAGVTLRFSRESYLLVQGYIIAAGTEEKPIILEPSGDSWKGLYVVEAEKDSLLRHVTIRNTDFFKDGILSLTGGVNFYKSPVRIERSHFLGTVAEDALNIIKSNYRITESVFSDTQSDALDSDFSVGQIISTKFERIGGDSVDCSGSQVTVDGLTVSSSRDKGISAGEKSFLTIKNSAFKNVGVGLAAKDGSRVDADHVSISDYKLYAVMAYVKKSMFGFPEMRLSNSRIEGKNPYARQKGSFLSVDSLAVKEVSLDVDKLYSEEVMRK